MDILDEFVALFLIGVFLWFQVGLIFYRWWIFRSWEAVPAQIEQLNFEEEEVGTETRTLIVKSVIAIRYRYTTHGRQHQNSTVGIYDRLLAVKNYDERLYARLLASHSSKQGINVYFDPNNPSRSCVNRSFYTPRAFYLILGATLFTLPAVYSLATGDTIEMDVFDYAVIVGVLLLFVVQIRKLLN